MRPRWALAHPDVNDGAVLVPTLPCGKEGGLALPPISVIMTQPASRRFARKRDRPRRRFSRAALWLNRRSKADAANARQCSRVSVGGLQRRGRSARRRATPFRRDAVRLARSDLPATAKLRYNALSWAVITVFRPESPFPWKTGARYSNGKTHD